MERLAKVGFNQSYTYFTWRQSSWELRQYFEDLATRTVDYFRPNAWPNTPDILTEQLQTGGRGDVRQPGRPRRHAVAVVGRLRPGVRARRARAGATRLGGVPRLREVPAAPVGPAPAGQPGAAARPAQRDPPRSSRRSPTCARCTSTTLADPALLCYSKTDPAGVGPPILVVVNLDAQQRQQGYVDVDLEPLGLPYESTYDVVDQLTGATFRWHGCVELRRPRPSRRADAHLRGAIPS